MSEKKISKLEAEISRDLFLFRNIIFLLANIDPDRITGDYINCLALSLIDHIDRLLTDYESLVQKLKQASE